MAKKGGDATLPGAYRGIGIQSAVARPLAMLVLRRLAPAVERANLLGRAATSAVRTSRSSWWGSSWVRFQRDKIVPVSSPAGL